MEYQLQQMKAREFMPGYKGKILHTERMSLVFWEVEAGAEVPVHHHENEQIMHVLEGTFHLAVAGRGRDYGPGSVVVIPSGSPHGGKALTQCRLIDVFSPVREAYR